MIQKIGIVGAGQMGIGIAQVCAMVGYDVVLTDKDEAILKKGIEEIERHMTRQVARSKLSDTEMKEAFDQVKGQVGFKGFEGCDLVIEAVNESENLKKAVFKELVPHLGAKTLIASNTSSISITALSSVTDRPDRFIGLHFMNPVPIMELVEVIRGLATSDETFKACLAVVDKLGKQHAVSQDFPGFIVNRIVMPMVNEACYALFEGIGTIEAIDKGMKLGTNHPMGPFELADLIGLDTCYSIMEVLHQGLNGAKYQPCPLLLKYVEAGWLGRKTGRGFYDYSGEKPIPTR